MQNKIYLIITLFTIATNPGYTQDLNQNVSVNYQDQNLGSILDNMEQEFGLKFSFLSSTIPLDSTISLNLVDQPLATVLNVLSEQAGLEYKVVKDHIALFHSTPSTSEIEMEKKPNIEYQVDHETPGTSIGHPVEENEEIEKGSTPSEIKNARLDEISLEYQEKPDNNLSKISYVLAEESTSDQQKLPRKKLIYLGPVVSAGFYSLSGNSKENEGYSYKSGFNYGIGLSAKLKVREHWGVHIQILYSTKNFDLHYDFKVLDQDDPFVPERTGYFQSYLDIPLLFNYKVWQNRKWELSGEAGFVAGILLNSEKQTFHKDGSEMETPEFLATKIRPELFAVQLGATTEYKINESFLLILSAGWRQYFNGITKENIKTKLGLFRGTTGLHYAF